MARLDPHSYTDAEHPLTRHIGLELEIDFDAKILKGSARLELERPAEGFVDLDTRDLEIHAVTDKAGEPIRYELGPRDPIIGSRLRAHTTSDQINLSFSTSPTASALQWLAPAQTAGGQQPYVFTQCQAIHARSVFPCQDTPKARVSYQATLRIPKASHAVMAAAHLGRGTEGDWALERFEMAQPIPPYLFAFAVGDIQGRELSPRSKVFAEPSILDAAAYEFAEVEQMIECAEGLFGPYDWERFDILVMPPSFPYGGMENPRMTFLTPTLLAGDRSLVNVLAHELAHSWTGNLVTNATMNDFWLNEGFTTYAERRILEALEGEERVALHAAIGFRGLSEEIERFGSKRELTRLRTKLEGVDPDQVYSRIPYEKGYLFLRRVEEEVGRERFDTFLKRYIERFRFEAISTQDFLDFVNDELPNLGQAVDLEDWIDGPGIPADAPRAQSERLDSVLRLARDFDAGTRITRKQTEGWAAQEWELYLQALPRKLSKEACQSFEREFAFSSSQNAEIRIAWLTIAAHSAFEPNFPAIRKALKELGRMKYLRPLYVGLLRSGSDAARRVAREVFAEAESSYHPVAASVVRGLLEQAR